MDRILVVHNRYRSAWPSGEDQVFDAEVDQLRRHGHEVATLERHNDGIVGTASKFRAALGTIRNAGAVSELRARISQFDPHVVHFHNTFPLVSPSAVREAARSDAAVVVTLHNYRLVCVAGTLFREGQPCEECLCPSPSFPRGRVLPALRHGCYRESRTATLAPAVGQWVHGRLKTWDRSVDRFVCPSEFARDKLVDAGLPRDRVSVKRHFLHPDPRVSTRHDGPAIFLGRLDSVKGADLLLDAWTRLPDLPLTMVGDGPLREPLERLAQERNLPVRFLGLRSPEECRELLRDAGFLVFPSPAHETFGLAVRDAMALGKPILAPDRGAASELVDTECSLRFRSGDAEDLASNARTLAANAELRDRLGAAARRKFEEELGDEPAYRQLMEIYRHATLAC